MICILVNADLACWLTNCTTGVVIMNNIYEEIRKPKKDFLNHSYISFKNKYFYHSVGKAANSTVKHYLYSEELRGTGFKYKSVHDRMESPLLSPFQVGDDELFRVLFGNEYFRFTFVRNPYVRILSCYLDRIRNENSAPYKDLVRWCGAKPGYEFTFDEFVVEICRQDDSEQNNHWRLQYADAMCHIVDYSFIGKQENFAKDMAVLWSSIYPGVTVPDFDSVNKSPAKTGSADKLKSFWTKNLVNIFSERYEKDFVFFGYSSFIDEV